jgi:hypothetical protein
MYSPGYASLADLSSPAAERGELAFLLPSLSHSDREGGRVSKLVSRVLIFIFT